MSDQLQFRPIDHATSDHTWADVDSIAEQQRGRVSIVVRKYKRKEWSAKIIGLACERYRVAWACRAGNLDALMAACEYALSRLYPADAASPYVRNIGPRN